MVEANKGVQTLEEIEKPSDMNQMERDNLDRFFKVWDVENVSRGESAPDVGIGDRYIRYRAETSGLERVPVAVMRAQHKNRKRSSRNRSQVSSSYARHPGSDNSSTKHAFLHGALEPPTYGVDTLNDTVVEQLHVISKGHLSLVENKAQFKCIRQAFECLRSKNFVNDLTMLSTTLDS